MPAMPRRMQSRGRNQFPGEWNKIRDWFEFIASEFVKTDGTIKLDVDSSGVMIGATHQNVLRFVEATETISASSSGKASQLERGPSGSYELMDPEHIFTIRTDVSDASLASGERTVVGRFRDGDWQVLPTTPSAGGSDIVVGTLAEPMERGDSGIRANLGGQLVDNVFDPGQIPSGIILVRDSIITWVRDSGILISFDCDNTAQEDPSAPTANDDTYSVDEDAVLNVVAPGVLTNDTDPQGDSLTVLTGSVGGPFNGTVTLNNDGSFSYTPDPDFFGEDIFTYKATDGIDESLTATVEITVNAVNDPPEANDDDYSTPKNVTLTVDAPGVLGNDTDPDGDTLVVAAGSRGVIATAGGQVTLNADGSFTYDPNPPFTGTDAFTYFANDGTVDSPTAATVKITVT